MTPARARANKKWRDANAEGYRGSLKDWREKNRPHVREWMRKRRLGLLGPFTEADGPDWQERNRQDFLEKKRVHTNEARKRDHLEAVQHYGNGKCFCCGEDEPIFLALDHINGDGGKHRKELSGSQAGVNMARWAKRNGWPPIFRVACHNCNHGLFRLGGTCPHQLKRKKRKKAA